ncbi:aspartate aminotransferase family protein [Polyangium jinanense]|uniref:Acetylornithine aminotransferase n=1 Tax=Polyangium jinanense TaxID=2829994 RepID=A0A9X3X0Q3_9BACT|nr:aspartate aminotransferase family protein [Polyangium jinanense]MDC3979301.1 aspartate aminotransferase family protein [Polyangium jinanense]
MTLAPAYGAESPIAELLEPEDLLPLAERRLVGNYRQAPFVLDRGKGSEVWDTEGRRYLDFCAGVAVCSLGHAHPRLVAAIAEQAARLMHVSNYFYNAENARLADELCKRSGMDRAFFCNSGAEANEAMLKLARRYFFSKGEPDRYRIIAFDNAFHGRTMGAVALTGTPKYREGFGPPLAGVTHVPYGDLDAVKAAMGPDVAAIFVEPVQGEGGVIPPPQGFLPSLRSLCDEHGALLCLDEVQTGIGRTGAFLGTQHDGVEGDAIALAKGLGGGFPIGALLIKERLNGALTPGTHGSTFGGNALASRAARTVLAVLDEEKLVEGAVIKGKRLAEGLAALTKEHPTLCTGQRGRGLLQGLTLAQGVDTRAVLGRARAEGLLLTVAGASTLRYTPPLVVHESEIDEAIAITGRVLSEMKP